MPTYEVRFIVRPELIATSEVHARTPSGAAEKTTQAIQSGKLQWRLTDEAGADIVEFDILSEEVEIEDVFPID